MAGSWVSVLCNVWPELHRNSEQGCRVRLLESLAALLRQGVQGVRCALGLDAEASGSVRG